MAKSKPAEKNTDLSRLRLDKWLWAARFYKTRSVAKHAIEGGKVYCGGSRCKPGKEVEIGMEIRLRQALSEQRRGAPEAQLLYAETEESIELREKQALERKAQPSVWQSDGKPNKRDRRLIHRFKQS